MGWAEDKIEQIAATVALENQMTRAELAQAFAETQRGQRVDGARPRPIVPNAVNYSSGRRLAGWSVRANGGDVTLTLYDGNDTSGDVIGTTVLTAGESQTVTLPAAGVSFVSALYVEKTGAGTAVGALWITAVE